MTERQQDKNSTNIHNIFNKWLNSFKTRNIPKMTGLLTDNIKISSLLFRNYNGIEGARKYWDELFKAFPDIEINPVTIAVDNRKNRIITEMDIRGTQKGKVVSSPAFRKKFRIRGAFVYDFKGNKIKEIRMYYDSSILKRQLNILKT